MRTRVTTLFLACAAFVSVVAVAPAQAACRPTTLADLFPPVPETTAPPMPAPPAPAGAGDFSDHRRPPRLDTATRPRPPSPPPVDPNSDHDHDHHDRSRTTTTATDRVDDHAPVPAPIPVARCSYVYRMQWPVLGGGAVLSVFGADRDLGARHHAGVDISAPKMTPVVAVRDGTDPTIHDRAAATAAAVGDHA